MVEKIDEALSEKIEKALGKMVFHPPFDIKEAKDRLRRGYYFIILEDGREIIGWCWAGIGTVYVPEIQKSVVLGRGEAIGLNAYIAEDYRGKGLIGLVYRKKFESLNADGYTKILGFPYSWNQDSIKSMMSSAWRIVGDYYYIRLLFIKIRCRRKREQYRK